MNANRAHCATGAVEAKPEARCWISEAPNSEGRTAEQIGLFGEEYLGGRAGAGSGKTADIDPWRAEVAGGVAAIPGQGIEVGGQGSG